MEAIKEEAIFSIVGEDYKTKLLPYVNDPELFDIVFSPVSGAYFTVYTVSGISDDYYVIDQGFDKNAEEITLGSIRSHIPCNVMDNDIFKGQPIKYGVPYLMVYNRMSDSCLYTDIDFSKGVDYE